ncbi:MAG: hypothetical protein Q8P07_06335 [bacterium]|nr:hypothetical protein [bacterium]
MDNLEFEKKFKESGFASQRRYPNEALIQFLAKNYFDIQREREREQK